MLAHLEKISHNFLEISSVLNHVIIYICIYNSVVILIWPKSDNYYSFTPSSQNMQENDISICNNTKDKRSPSLFIRIQQPGSLLRMLQNFRRNKVHLKRFLFDFTYKGWKDLNLLVVLRFVSGTKQWNNKLYVICD